MSALKPPGALSPSSLDSYRLCPYSWAQEKIYKIKSPTNLKAEMGTFGHAVVEQLMGLEPQERTRLRAKEISNTLWKAIESSQPELFGMVGEANLDGKLASANVIAKFVNKGIDGWFSLLTPKKAHVHSTEQWVEGFVGTTPMRGYIDLVVYDGPRLKVIDKKTGKVPWGDDVAKKLTQVSVYCALLEEQGLDVASGWLYYSTYRKKFGIDWDDEAKATLISETGEVWANILADCEAGVFEATPNFLCSNDDPAKVWCRWKSDGCPAWADKEEEW